MRASLALSALSLVLACACSSDPPGGGDGGGAASVAGSDGSTAGSAGSAGGGQGGSAGLGGSSGATSAGVGGSVPGSGGSSAQAGGAGASGGTPNGGGGTAGTSGGASGGGAGASGTSGGGNGNAGSGGGGSGVPITCDRAGMQAAVDAYIAGLEAGGYENVPLAITASYSENENRVGFGEGIWEDPMKVDFHRSLFDVMACASFTEIIVTDEAHPYVLGARIDVADGAISNISVIVTDEGDWAFDADRYLMYSEPEDWSVIPEADRLTREELHEDAASYFKYWGDRSVVVPWGMPCARIEGGEAYTGTRCDVGIPEETDFEPMPTDYLIDPDHGMVVLYVDFGNPDTHLFRILKTGIRYVHTLTVQ